MAPACCGPVLDYRDPASASEKQGRTDPTPHGLLAREFRPAILSPRGERPGS